MGQEVNDNLKTDVLDWINGANVELKINLPNRIYDYILTQIFLGNLSFGQRIRESQITKELDVSSVPVREAFIRLREEGWIETIPNCGAKVVDYLNPNKHKELYDMRLSIETGIYYCLAEKITSKQLSELETIINQLEAAYETGNSVDYRRLDAEFHMKTVFYAGGERMQRIYRPIFLQWCIMIHLYHGKSELSMTPENANQVPKEIAHRALYKALRAKDVTLAAELIRNHFYLPK